MNAESNTISRKMIETSLSNVKLSDHDDETNLDLFCYIQCNNESSDDCKQCRGIVFDGEQLVLNAFPYTDTYTSQTPPSSIYSGDFSKINFYDSHEGALIRVFWYKNKWFISTHRKLNAFKSKWASKESFGLSFQKALESEVLVNDVFRSRLEAIGTIHIQTESTKSNVIDLFLKTLNESLQYMFLLKNTGMNCIVCLPPERPTVLHVGTFENGKLNQSASVDIPHPALHIFRNFNDVFEYVETIRSQNLQGVIAFLPNARPFKILSNEYNTLFNIRGNEPSVKFRYLQLRMDREKNNSLRMLYPDAISTFESYENSLYEIALMIYANYVKRYIKKEYVTVAKGEFEVMKKAHTLYLDDRLNNKISVDRIIDLLNEQTPTSLNHMIRQLELSKRPQNVQENTENTKQPRNRPMKSLLPKRKIVVETK